MDATPFWQPRVLWYATATSTSSFEMLPPGVTSRTIACRGLLSHLVVVFTYSCSCCWAAELVIVCGILSTVVQGAADGARRASRNAGNIIKRFSNDDKCSRSKCCTCICIYYDVHWLILNVNGASGDGEVCANIVYYHRCPTA